MPTEKRPPLRPARRPRATQPAPEPDDAAGLGDVPPGLAYERTATAAEDEGFDAVTASVFAAVVAVDVYCVAEANAAGPRSLEPLVRAADLAERALEADGAGEAEFTHLFAPRLPFDVLVREGARLTAADLFLARWGDELPAGAVRAVKALLRAEDTAARATRDGGRVTIEDLSTGRLLPGPALWRPGTKPFVCRLVRVGGAHVPVAVERVEGRVTVEALLGEVKAAATVARDVLKAGGIRLRSLRKGFGLGARLLAVPDGE